MARKVKCCITGEIGTNETFYKASNGKYYKDEKIYQQSKKEANYRKDILSVFANDFLNYKKGQVFPTILVKELKSLEYYSNEVIYFTIKECHEKIMWAIENKQFKTDVAKCRYIMAIIKNNINDYKRQLDSSKKIKEKQSKQVEEIVNIEIKGTSQKGKDISKWLEEDE